MNKKRLLSAILSGVMLFASVSNIVFADGETTETPREATETVYQAENVTYRFDASDGTTVLQDCTNVDAGQEGNVGPQIKLNQTTASVVFKDVSDLSDYNSIKLNFAAKNTATITFEGSVDGNAYTKVGEITTDGADRFDARTASTAISNAAKSMTYLKVSWEAQSTDQWYNSITLINDKIFDASVYDYTGAIVNTTPITDIWTGWEMSADSNFKHTVWGGINTCGVFSTGILTSPGYAQNTSGYRMEFVLQGARGAEDTLVFDADGVYSFGYCYAAPDNGFWPQDGERGDLAGHVLNWIKEDGNEKATYTTDKSIMRIEVKNHNDSLTVGETTYTSYYTVKFSIDSEANGTFTDIVTEYYSGSVNGFGGINVGTHGMSAGYGKLKIIPANDIQENDRSAYAAIAGNIYCQTFADAMSMVATNHNTNGKYAVDPDGNHTFPKVTMLNDTEHKSGDLHGGNSKWIDGNGKTITFSLASDWLLLENANIKYKTDTAGANIAGASLTGWGRFNNVTFNGNDIAANCFIENHGYIKNSTIDGYYGKYVATNWRGSDVLIEKSSIINTKTTQEAALLNQIDNATFTIKDSTVTGTKNAAGEDKYDVNIANGNVVLEGETTVGTLNGSTSANLTLKNFTGSVKLMGLTDVAAETKLAKIEGEYSGTVTVDGLGAGFKLEAEEVTEGDKYLVVKTLQKADAPNNATVNYSDEKIGGLESGGTYIITISEGETVKTDEVTLGETETAIDITDYIGKTISIVRKGEW